MSGELQTIPARHGVATFVPRGRTIKIINTYGKQVVSTWAFGLGAPPEEGEEDEDEVTEENIEEKTEQLKREVTEDQRKEAEAAESSGSSKEAGASGEDTNIGKDAANKAGEEADEEEHGEQKQTESTEEHEDPPEQELPATPENEKATKSTESTQETKQPQKRTWASYLPSIPYRSRGAANQPQQKAEEKPDPKTEKEQNEATSKKWSSYMPTGKSFSSYVPNMQMPDSSGVVSAFKASHYRDPNKSYAEQLYDFSKTPVGAGGIAAATGSGTASSLYAAYNAYRQLNPNDSSQPPMEYLSLPHTRAATHRLVPEVDDTLLTNLRSPIMTLIEDTTPGAHDTLTAACDASQYLALGVDKPEEHGSCAENLVLALKELNEKAGLKGTKAVGADITVNIAPTPLHLFMNAPISLPGNSSADGSGAKGSELSIDAPNGKKRSYVRFRAERDIVIVMSACPMEIGKQNGGKCMAANFMVEEANDEDLAASTSSLKKKAPKKLYGKKPVTQKEEPEQKEETGEERDKVASKPIPKPRGGPAKIQGVKKSAEAAEAKRKDSVAEQPKGENKDAPKEEKKVTAKAAAKEDGGSEEPKPKKKPKKLERRGATPAKSDAA